MSAIGKRAKARLTKFDPDSPSLELHEGGELDLPLESLDAFAELVNKLRASHWFCEVGEA